MKNRNLIVLLILSCLSFRALSSEVPNSSYPKEKEFKDYKVDKCEEKLSKDVKVNKMLKTLGLRKCKDQTMSYIQPSSRGVQGYEGKCGQTAASNIVYMFCNIPVDTEKYIDKYFSDITPGVLPKTLKSGLNAIFHEKFMKCPQEDGEWRVLSYESKDSFIQGVKKSLNVELSQSKQVFRSRESGDTISRAPIASLVRIPGSQTLHWVVIVDLIEKDKSCNFIVNHWDSQYKIPCSVYSRWSRTIEDLYGLFLGRYLTVSFVKK